MPKYVESVLPHNSQLGDDPTDIMASSGRVIIFTHISSGKSVGFKAFVTKFEDSYTPRWNPTEVYGRMDPISTYQNTQRKITLEWDIPAASAYDAYKNLQRVSQLIRMLYPTYTNATANRTLKSSPLMRLKFMNLSRDVRSGKEGLVGYINGTVTYTPDMEQGVFDGDDGTLAARGIYDAFDEPSIYPKLVKLSCNFTVLHTHPMGFSDQWDEIPRGEGAGTSEKNSNFDNGPGEAYPYGVDRRPVMSPGDVATDSVTEQGPAVAPSQAAAAARALGGEGK